MQQQALRVVRGVLAAGAVLAAMYLSSAFVSAHHGWGGYQDATTDITGIVDSPVSMSGPHATMKVKVDGQIWDVVLAPPPRAAQAGLKDGMIPVGEKVTVHGNRHRDSKKFEIKTSRLTWNGKVFAVYPDRN
jgi:membrane protein implicated in regulation of membrane protease activity